MLRKVVPLFTAGYPIVVDHAAQTATRPFINVNVRRCPSGGYSPGGERCWQFGNHAAKRGFPSSTRDENIRLSDPGIRHRRRAMIAIQRVIIVGFWAFRVWLNQWFSLRIPPRDSNIPDQQRRIHGAIP